MKFIKKIKNIIFFINFCRKKFIKASNKGKKSLVLIEFNSIIDCYIPYAYFVSHLSKKFNAKVVCYNDLKKKSFYNFFLYFLMKFNPINKFSMYKSFGVSEIIYFNSIKKTLNPIIEKKYRLIIKNIKNKRKIEKLKINDILVVLFMTHN